MPDGELDESYHFALSLVPMLHRLDKDKRQQAKIEILNTLHNLENSQRQPLTDTHLLLVGKLIILPQHTQLNLPPLSVAPLVRPDLHIIKHIPRKADQLGHIWKCSVVRTHNGRRGPLVHLSMLTSKLCK